MAHPRIDVGMYVIAKAPLAGVEMFVSAANVERFDSVFIWDHVQDFFPSSIWDESFTWLAGDGGSPHEWFEFQTLLGYLAGKHPGMRLGVGVSEPIRRHPVILAQAALTLAHLSEVPPILGLGSGERIGSEPHGLDFTNPVSRLEEALQIIRLCFDARGPIDFEGKYFRLQGAIVDLLVPDGRKPEIWVAAHGPRMLRLTGQYADGWYPFAIASPDDYAARLQVIQDAAASAGRDPDAITPALHAITIVAPTEDEARAMLDTRPIRFFGLLFPDIVWQAFGLRHPLGEDFGGYLDIIPETLDRQTVDAALDAVPMAMLEMLFWGTPEQVIAKFRAFGEAGMRHVVPLMASALVSPDAATYSMEALTHIAHALQGTEMSGDGADDDDMDLVRAVEVITIEDGQTLPTDEKGPVVTT